MNDFIQFLQTHLTELLTLAFGVVSAGLNLLLARIVSKINKKIEVIDIDGDGLADIDPKFNDYYIRCKHCRKYTKLSEASFFKEVNDEEKS